MRVIGVGFGRTGTASLKLALERLGVGPCYHMLDVIDQPARARAWLDAADGQPPAWDGIFAGFESTVDWPAAAFWRELIEFYPDAMVILSMRDPQRWYDSAERTIFRAARRSDSPLSRQVLRLMTVAEPEFRDFVAMADAVVMQRVFDGRVADRAHAIAVFERHIADVRATVSPDRLLVFDVAQGWLPLCTFLDLPVPDESFPHVNDAVEFNRLQAARMRRLTLPVIAAGAAVTAALIASVAFAVRRTRRRSRR
jgi:hypothetical protein